MFKTYTTEGNPDWPQPVDFNGSASGVKIFMPCQDLVYASAQVMPIDPKTGTAWVFTVIVSNDPKGKEFFAYPTATTLTNSARICAPLNVSGYLYFGVQLTTAAGAAALGHIFLAGKDLPT